MSESLGKGLTVQLQRQKGLQVSNRVMKVATGRSISCSNKGTGTWMRCMSMPIFSFRLQRCGKRTAPLTKRSSPSLSGTMRHRSSCRCRTAGYGQAGPMSALSTK